MKLFHRIGLVLAIIAAILAVIALCVPAAAYADGDPASDILVLSRLFVPSDLTLSPRTVAQLDAELSASARAGFPIRVALINSASDLGTIPQLFSRPPQDYADYLGTELADLYGGQILVVLPTGFGLYGPAHGRYALTQAEERVRALKPAAGPRLALAAISAVPLLARAAGHPIATTSIHVAALAPAPSSMPPAAWAALVCGWVLVILAWRASLKARPLNAARRLGS